MAKSCNVTLETLTTLSCGRVYQWIDQPNHRGTIDIIWTSVITIFISTYTILCLNVGSPKDTTWSLLRRKLKWMLLGIAGPEIVLTYAAGQWSRARHSVEAFHRDGHWQWTIRQAFFADMGGFVLQARDSKPFPVNAKQLHWLVANKHLDYPKVTVEEIWDKSKQDTLAKVITAVQVGYLVVQVIGRAAQHLAITTLELNALAIVICSLMTSYAWLHKPLDISRPIEIHSEASIDEICQGQPWNNTPLDFVDENGPGWSINLMPFMKMPTIPPKRPIQRIPNDRFPMNPYGSQEYFLCFATLLFTAVHVAGWNYSFPTNVEKILWRVCSLLLFSVTAVFWIFETMASWVRLGRWKKIYYWVSGLNDRFDESKEIEATRSQEEPEAFVPTIMPLPWEFWTITPLALMFAFARGFLLIEGALELRAAPASAFKCVDWSSYLPHL